MSSVAFLTPGSLAERGSTAEVSVPEYDWQRQQRWNENCPVAGNFTASSVQTFDGQGRPSDSRSDHND